MGGIRSKLVGIESGVRVADTAIAIDYKRCRHIFRAEAFCDLALAVVDDLELRGEALEKRVRKILVMIDVHRDHDQAARPVGLLDLAHPRKGLAAGRAPRRPEVQINDFALIGAEIEIGSLSSRRDAGRSGQQAQ